MYHLPGVEPYPASHNMDVVIVSIGVLVDGKLVAVEAHLFYVLLG